MDELDPYTILAEMFSNKSIAVIENIIQIVEENSDCYSSADEKLEAMINLLTESGTADIENIAGNELLNEAAGFTNNECSYDSQDQVSDVCSKLVAIFPDADPTYLEETASKLAFDEQKLKEFINDHLENNDYPKYEDYLRKKSEQSEMDKYLFRFRLYQYLLEFPDPFTHFSSPNRKHAFSNIESIDTFEMEREFVLKCLYNQFTYLRESDIKKVFKICDKDIIKTYNKLNKIPRAFKVARKKCELPNISINNILLLQEIAFIQHEKELSLMKQERVQNFKRAEELGLLESCNCCLTDDLIPEDCFLCRNGCKFCKECIRKGAEIAYAEGKTEFACLANCGSDYSPSTLQMVLNPKTFTNLCHTIQMKEITNAGIEDIEFCPLCFNFAMIPDPNDKIFHCEFCKKDSCRGCKHEAHLPKRCNEIEYDEDVQMRTYIENKMTEALLRKCPECGKSFIKNTGCNKITCSCGTCMCYLCGVRVQGYSHFNTSICPLFTNDDELHFKNVMKGANAAKADLGVDRNPEKLKFDPVKGFENTA